uniref:Uncharacterized protein n=1 Tax=Fagus sylvatica TaxID=28930 RepID=A0A2N9FG72_FAGSY
MEVKIGSWRPSEALEAEIGSRRLSEAQEAKIGSRRPSVALEAEIGSWRPSEAQEAEIGHPGPQHLVTSEVEPKPEVKLDFEFLLASHPGPQHLILSFCLPVILDLSTCHPGPQQDFELLLASHPGPQHLHLVTSEVEPKPESSWILTFCLPVILDLSTCHPGPQHLVTSEVEPNRVKLDFDQSSWTLALGNPWVDRSLMAQRGDTWHGRVPEAWPRVPCTCYYVLASGDSSRSLASAWGRVQHPMEAIPTANGISSTKESESGVSFLNRSWEAPILGFERCGGARRVNHCLRHFLRRVEARANSDGGLFHRQMVDLPKRTPMVVPLCGFGAQNDYVLECECGGSAWWRIERRSIQWLRWLLDWMLGSSSSEAHRAWRSLEARK